MEKPKFVPVREASTKRVNLQGVVFPPFVETDRIGVNTRRIERLMNIGGIKTLTVKTINGEISSEMPTVVGMTEQGGALAGKKAAKTIVPVFDSRSNSSDESVPISFRWADAHVVINMDEVSQRLEQQKKWKNGVRSVPGWAHYVDKAITEGLRKIGNNNLTGGEEFKYIILHSLNWGMVYGGLEMINAFNLNSRDYAVLATAATMAGDILAQYMEIKPMTENKRHLSLFWGSQFDRAYVLGVAAKMTKVAKEIPRGKEVSI